MIELVVPPIIIIVIVAALIISLSRAVRYARESDEMPDIAKSQSKQRWYTKLIAPLIDKVDTAKSKTREIAQRRRMSAAVEEARSNRDVTPQQQSPVEVQDSQYEQPSKQQLFPMGEIILSHRNAARETGDQVMNVLISDVENRPQDPDAYERLGENFITRENYSDARECYRYILRLDPRHRRAQEAMKNLDRILG